MVTSWVVRTKFAVRGSAVDLHEDISSSVVVSERIAACLGWGLTNMSSEIILSNTGNDPQSSQRGRSEGKCSGRYYLQSQGILNNEKKRWY
jgi:hypothetical protein